MSDLYVDGLPAGAYLTEAVKAATKQPVTGAERFWASQPLTWTSDARDVLQVEFSGYRMVNHVTFLTARFPHIATAEYWDPAVNDWKPLREQTDSVTPIDPAYSVAAQRERWEGGPVSHTVIDSYPAVISAMPDQVIGVTHPQHFGGAKHWVPVTWRVIPVYTRAVRIVLNRPGYLDNTQPWLPPTDKTRALVPYSLAVKGLQVGYRVYGETDIPDAFRASLEDFATSADLLGSRLSYRLKTYSPDAVSSDEEGLHWRCEPQPVNYAVVNFYTDVRDRSGEAQVIDRFFIDPLTVGPTLNLYYTNDDPDADFEADDSPLTYPTGRVNGVEPVVERDPATGEAKALNFTSAPGNIQIDNAHLQWDPARPWWVGLSARLETETGTHPWLAWSGNTIRQNARSIEFVAANGETHSVAIPASVAVGDDFTVTVLYRPDDPTPGTPTPEDGGYWAAESSVTIGIGAPDERRIRTRQFTPEAFGSSRPETLYLGAYSIGKVWRQATEPPAGVHHRWAPRPAQLYAEKVGPGGDVLKVGQIPKASSWTLSHPTTRPESVAPTGPYSARLDSTVGGSPTPIWAGLENIPCLDRKAMRLFYRVRTTTPTPGQTEAGLHINVYYYDAAGNLVNGTSGVTSNGYATAFPNDGEWHTVSNPITTIDGVHHMTLRLQAGTAYGSADLEVDVLGWTYSDPGVGPAPGSSVLPDPEIFGWTGDDLDERARDLWYDDEGQVHSWNSTTNTWEAGSHNVVVQAEAAALVLKGLVLKIDELPERGHIEGFLDDPDLFLLKSAAPGLALTKNALLRIHPTFWTGENLAAAVGGPGDRYEDAVWTPIPRDYTLRQGFLRFPPVKAKHFKFEFTNLVHMNFENLVPIRREVKLFPPALVEQHQRLILPDATDTQYRSIVAFGNEASYDYTKDAPGVRTMMDMITVGNYASAINRLRDISQNLVRQDSRTEAYVAKDPLTQKELADLGWVWSFTPWHIASSAPRWSVAAPHSYETVAVSHDSKVAFFVGIKRLQPYRVDYLTDDDTEVYEETFADATHIASWEGMEFTGDGISAFSNKASVTSKVLPSTRNVRGVQFATVQSDAVALLPDDGFVNPDLGQNWNAYGDASLTRLVGQGVLLSRGVMPETGGGGGIVSGAVFASTAGRIYAAARVTPQTANGGPVRLEIVSLATGSVIAAEERTISPGEEMVMMVGYEVGSANTRLTYGDLEDYTYGDLEEGTNGDNVYAPGTYGDLETDPIGGPVYVRFRQLGHSTDRILIERLSLFDVPVVWQFSVDGGTTWYDGMGVRNNPEAVLTFPEPGKELVWRALIFHNDAEISALSVRPWYGGLIGSLGRTADDFVGPNRSVIDDYPDTAEDPMWQQTHNPIPGWWYRRDVANPFSAAPNILVDGQVVMPEEEE